MKSEEELLKQPNYRRTDYGVMEKLCPKCHEWWPADREFFYKEGNGLTSWCKACISEWKRDRKLRGITDRFGRLIRKVCV